MPRSPRLIEGNTVYHILNRANARMTLFDKEKDYLAFEKVLIEAKEKYAMRILAYCIMPNHWHFLLYPYRGADLPLFMRWLTQTHSQRWLTHRRRTGYGHLYQGRYKSFPVQEDGHFLQVARYVERNALRARLTKKAEDWRWGSAWIIRYGLAKQKKILSPWPVPRPCRYIDWLNQSQPHEEEVIENLRLAVNRGKPFGLEAWAGRMAVKLGLTSTLRLRGRPKKVPDPFVC